MMKVCYRCNEQKPISEFNKNRTRKDGLMAACRPCTKTRMAKHYQENKERIRLRVKNYRDKNAKKAYAHRLVNSWIKRGYLKPPNNCSKCGNASDSVINAHHPDYDKPWEYIWLCISCHKTIHNSNVGKL